jgi:hypothetical protein
VQVERDVETEGFKGGDHWSCDAHQRPASAISDGAVHDELVCTSQGAYDEFVLATDCAVEATGQPAILCIPFPLAEGVFVEG